MGSKGIPRVRWARARRMAGGRPGPGARVALATLTMLAMLDGIGRAETDPPPTPPRASPPPEPAPLPPTPSESLFTHRQPSYWISGQANLITQGHPGFSSLYASTQSLRSQAEEATSFVGTLFTGFHLTSLTDAIVDVEMAAGGGISQAFGLGGFTNLDVVRNPTLSHEPYLARVMLRQIIPLGGAWTDVEQGPFQIGTRLPVRRLELSAGKLSTVDFFDKNSSGSDSHLQFLNWTVDNNGAYDYAADTRGYTYGVVVAYESPRFAARFGEMLMPKVANGIDFDWDVRSARAENLELELRYRLAGRPGIVRALSYLNHADMGSYRQAIDAFEANAGADQACRLQFEAAEMRQFPGPGPVIECHRAPGRLKLGVGLNIEQQLAGPLRGFGRAGWNDGRNESFAYTEVDNTVLVGLDLAGDWWRRPGDRFGAAFVSNGISDLHARYLQLGGYGFLLGDGGLTYGRETIFESYYTFNLGRGSSVAADIQYIANPGYNQDRGPVVVGALRLHQEL
jgi:high affinity Mn2+ porin